MRILHVTPAFHPAVNWGGPTMSAWQLCNHLAKLPGIELDVLTSDTSGPGWRDRLVPGDCDPADYPGYRVVFCRKMAGADFSPSLPPRLLAMARRCDVIHLTGVYSMPTLPTLLASRILGKPLVWSPRGALQRWAGSSRPNAKRMWDAACRALLGQQRIVLHATSAEEAAESAARIPSARVRIVANGVEIPVSLPVRDWRPSGRLRLLFLGRLDPKKGIECLLEAMASPRLSHAELRVCGSGAPRYRDALARKATELGLSTRVAFAGFVASERKAEEFAATDICVVPSHTENFGLVVAEALAHGVPVIASRGTPWRTLETRGAGLWVANDPDSLAAAVVRLADTELEELGRRGRRWMQAEFSWPKAARNVKAIYDEVASAEAWAAAS